MNKSSGARRWVWVMAFVPFIVLALLRVPEGPRLNEEDYAHNLLHAQAIADGRSYTDIGFIPTRLGPFGGPIARPPGLPLLLAPLVATGGVRSPLIPLLMVGLGTAFLVLASRAFSHREPAPLVFAIGLVSGLQPDVLHFASGPLTDLPFAALVWGVVVLSDRDEPWSGWRLVAITLAGAAAISVRQTGVALIPALAAFALLRYRTHGARAAIPLLVWCAAFWLNTNMLPTAPSYATLEGHVSRPWIDGVPQRMLTYGFAVLDAQLYPFPFKQLNHVYHAATLALLGIGALGAIRSYWRSFAGLLTGAYIAMLFAIPVVDRRYLYPLIPVVVVLTLRGLLESLRWMRPSVPEHRHALMVGGAATLIALFASVSQWRPVNPTGLAVHPDAIALFDRLRPLGASGARLFTIKPRVFTLETGVPAMALFGAPPARVVRELCEQGMTHVVVGDVGLFPAETALLSAAVEATPLAFREEYRNPSFTLMRFDAVAQRSASAASCPARMGSREGGP